MCGVFFVLKAKANFNVLSFSLLPHSQGEKEHWKELGLYPGSLALQATSLTRFLALNL